MCLKKPLWSETIQIGKGDSKESDVDTLTSTAVRELANSLNQQRVYREVTLVLRTSLRDASAKFSFLRWFQSSFNTLKETDDYNDNRVRNLNHIYGVEPMKITSPSTDAEVALALRVLEGCCLLHPQSTSLAHQYKAI